MRHQLALRQKLVWKASGKYLDLFIAADVFTYWFGPLGLIRKIGDVF